MTLFKDTKAYRLVYLTDEIVAVSSHYTATSYHKVEFFCSAVNCVTRMKREIKNMCRPNALGRCQQCGAQNKPVCKEKPLHCLPAVVHDHLTHGHSIGLSLNALIASVDHGLSEEKKLGVTYWARMYHTSPRVTSEHPVVDDVAWDDDARLEIDVDNRSNATIPIASLEQMTTEEKAGSTATGSIERFVLPRIPDGLPDAVQADLFKHAMTIQGNLLSKQMEITSQDKKAVLDQDTEKCRLQKEIELRRLDVEEKKLEANKEIELARLAVSTKDTPPSTQGLHSCVCVCSLS